MTVRCYLANHQDCQVGGVELFSEGEGGGENQDGSCHNPNDNSTQPQPQHCSWVGHENDFANPTTHHTNFSGTSRRARELKFGTDTH